MNPLLARALVKSGRSWWQARYRDGRVVSEWDTILNPSIFMPILLTEGRRSRWEEVPKQGMVGLRLLCPNGMCGELEAPEEWKFFQFKVGAFGVGKGQYCLAHVIGCVYKPDGTAKCRAWDTQTSQLLDFEDNVFNMKYHNVGRIAFDVQQLRI